jgi:hypothetical protein
MSEKNVWYPGLDYEAPKGDYEIKVNDVEVDVLLELVQTRIEQDGQWAIDNDRVGGKELKMRRMIDWATNHQNIHQCVEQIFKEGAEDEKTVGWVCREMTTAAQRIFERFGQ